MEHQAFSTYYQLSLKGHVEPWRCIDRSHEMFLFPLYDFENDQTILKCEYPDCNYFIKPGINFYDKVVTAIMEIDND